MKQIKSIRFEQYQCVELEGLKQYLAKSNIGEVTESKIFRTMLNFAIKNKEVVKDIIVRNGFVGIEELKVRSV